MVLYKRKKPSKRIEQEEEPSTAVDVVLPPNETIKTKASMAENQTQSMKFPDDSTATLVESILPLALPIIREVLSKQLIDDGSVIYNEEPVSTFNSKNLPLGELEIKIEDVLVMDRNTLKKDMESDPEFAWPEKDRVMSLMQNEPGKGRQMLVLDFVGFDFMIPFTPGYEFIFPIDVPLRETSVLEVGSGRKIDKPWIRLFVPRLRIWFVTETKMLYIAFIEQPKLTPNIHINVDSGYGDYFHFHFTENGSLDDVVEIVLSRFGPKFKDKKLGNEEESRETNVNFFTKKLASLVQSSMNGKTSDKNAPIQVDLKDSIEASINSAMGKPRSIEAIDADIAILQKEREKALQLEKSQQPPVNIRDNEVPDIHDDEQFSTGMFCSFLSCA